MARRIDEFVAIVRNAVYGKDVREGIARSMEETYDSCVSGAGGYFFTDDGNGNITIELAEEE